MIRFLLESDKQIPAAMLITSGGLVKGKVIPMTTPIIARPAHYGIPHFTGDATCLECDRDLPTERKYPLFCDDTCRNLYQANVAAKLAPLPAGVGLTVRGKRGLRG